MVKKINFTQLKHNENTIENQQHFDDNQPKFSNQCKIVYEALLRGEKLTTAYALIHYGIGHLPRRIKDLIDQFGIQIESRKVNGNFKEYYLVSNTSNHDTSSNYTSNA